MLQHSHEGDGYEWCWRPPVEKYFLSLLKKKLCDLNKDELRAYECYWNFCFKRSMDLKSPKAMQKRIRLDLKNFPNLNSLYADPRQISIDKSSKEWKLMEEIGVAHRIWDDEKGRFHMVKYYEDKDGPEFADEGLSFIPFESLGH
jgi:hypothetical protein